FRSIPGGEGLHPRVINNVHFHIIDIRIRWSFYAPEFKNFCIGLKTAYQLNTADRSIERNLNDTLIEHGVRDFYKAGNVRADYEVAGLTIFGGSIPRIFVNGSHNVTETLIDFLAWPGQPHGILGHLKAGNRDAARICSLAR